MFCSEFFQEQAGLVSAKASAVKVRVRLGRGKIGRNSTGSGRYWLGLLPSGVSRISQSFFGDRQLCKELGRIGQLW